MATIVIASSRKGTTTREIWADVIMAANSVTLYAPEHELILAWKGPDPPPELLDNPRARIIRQPDGCRSYGEAFGWAVEQTDDDELILLNDDAVLLPDTVQVLLEDAWLIADQARDFRLGFLACRSNFVPGVQNIRAPNEGELRHNFMRYDSEDRILPAARISPIAAFIRREALEAIGGFPPINWYSDDLMCYDLMRMGYTNFVSRAYVHHIGQRSTTQDGVTLQDLDRLGRRWVQEHRPDFWEVINGDVA
jgi:hypothetical protein